jgi:hypothetical protein
MVAFDASSPESAKRSFDRIEAQKSKPNLGWFEPGQAWFEPDYSNRKIDTDVKLSQNTGVALYDTKPCSKCKAKGVVRSWVIFTKPCPCCFGRGTLYFFLGYKV